MAITYVHQKVCEAITAMCGEGTRRERLGRALSSIGMLSPPAFVCPPKIEPAVSSWNARAKTFASDPASFTDEQIDGMLRDLVAMAHDLMQ